MKNIIKILMVALFVLVLTHPGLAYAYATSFCFDPSWQEVTEGDIFTVDVELNNADSTVFDTVGVWIGYDTSYMEVQDADAGETGVQIESDPYAIFGFDTHLANSVDTTKGEIDLQESFSPPTSSDKSGAFAKITFKALSPIASTDLVFKFNTWEMTPTTWLLRMSGDVLGDSANHTDGTTDGGVGINAIPEPTSLSLVGSALMGFLVMIRRRK